LWRQVRRAGKPARRTPHPAAQQPL
jgi:hypothetical protein